MLTPYLNLLLARVMRARALKKEEGQTMAEYALLLFLIAVIVMVVLAALGNRIAAIFTSITTALGG